MSQVSAQNNRGEWVPAIPEPLFVGRGLKQCKCDCGEIRKTRISYREHYALAHIVGLN